MQIPAFIKLPRYRAEADPLHCVTRVVALEKIDGANTRIGVPAGARDASQLIVGGRVLLEHEEGFSERALLTAVRQNESLVERLLALELSQDLVLYGETCGGKVQQMGFIYGPKPHFLLFAARLGGAWCSFERSPTFSGEPLPSLVKLAQALDVRLPPRLYEGPPDAAAMEALLDRPSQHSVDQGFSREDVDRTQEGIVIWADPLLLDPFGAPLVAKYKHPKRREYTQATEAGATPLDFAKRAAPDERLRHAEQHLRAAGKWSSPDDANTPKLVRRVIQDISKEVPEYQTQLAQHGKKAVRAALERVILERWKALK